jgi:adenosylhomocysteinase
MASDAPTQIACDIKDLTLADAGRRRTEWAFQSMPVLQSIRKQFIRLQPLAGMRISACMHVTTETANLMITMRDGGAAVTLCAANPHSTQDDVAATLVRDYNIPVYAIHGESAEVHQQHLLAAAENGPRITMDDGAALVTLLHTRRPDLAEQVIGGTEETSTGVARLRALAKEGRLVYPIVAINDASTKHLFDNHYGTGQSTLDALIRAANILVAGMTVVVAGYGWCGRGVASRARGLGANVIVTEVDAIKAIEAVMDGFRVMSMAEAARIGDVFITVTGNKHVICRDHFEHFKNGAILCNAGHSNLEIDLEALARMCSSRRNIRDLVDEHCFRDGRKIYVLAEGHLINLAAGEGHPASVMDISFANQALACDYMVKNYAALEKQVYGVPDVLNRQVAKLKLESMGVKIDRLTPQQEAYLAGWQPGA